MTLRILIIVLSFATSWIAVAQDNSPKSDQSSFDGSEPVPVYVLKYLQAPLPDLGKHDFISVTQGLTAGAAQSYGQALSSGIGTVQGAAVGGLLTGLIALIDLARPIEYDKPIYALVVGVDSKCEPFQITYPYKNQHYPKNLEARQIVDLLGPLRWVLLSRNEAKEIQIDPLTDRSLVRNSPCWNHYLATLKEKGKAFDAEAYYVKTNL